MFYLHAAILASGILLFNLWNSAIVQSILISSVLVMVPWWNLLYYIMYVNMLYATFHTELHLFLRCKKLQFIYNNICSVPWMWPIWPIGASTKPPITLDGWRIDVWYIEYLDIYRIFRYIITEHSSSPLRPSMISAVGSRLVIVFVHWINLWSL